jgi:uncharacterized protein (TIGR00255 family)
MQVEVKGTSELPIKSMTGFGSGRAMVGDVEVVTEVRTVNHRFLDISLRLPRQYSGFEPEVRRIVSQVVKRGKADVTVTRTGGKGNLMDVTLDRSLAASYHRCLQELKEEFGLAGTITISDMLSLKDIVVPVEREEHIEEEWALVETSLRNALNALDGMRQVEGAALWRDIEVLLKGIRESAALIPPLVHQVTAAAKQRLEKRVQELTGGLELDPERLLQEVALLADRSDVTEEITRMESHVDQFLSFGRQGSPLGRKLDFLLQELHREVNTMGAKSASTDIASTVVSIKADVEKIREQTQNIE